MRKLIIFVLILPIALLITAISAYATEEDSFDTLAELEASVVYFDNGSRLVISPFMKQRTVLL